MIKLIVTDMDGTFLNNDKEFPSDFFRIFEELEKRQILFCVASGRQYPSLLQFFEKVRTKIGFIPENGAWALLGDEELYQSPIDKDLLINILNVCDEIPQIGVAICGKKSAYLSSSNLEVRYEVQKHYPVLQYVPDFEAIDDTIFKITIYDKLQPQHNSLVALQSFLDKLRIVRSGDKWLDITNLSVNKGVAVEHLQQKLGIKKEETMAFGDYLNDIEMLQMAQYSYAMKNAQPEVKAVANFVTKYDNNEQGVLNTIAEMLNISLK